MSEERTQPSLDARLDNWANAARGSYDAVDAARIERSWQRLATRQRDLLRMVYLWRAGREVVCRRLRIPRNPWSRYEVELASAKQALASLLASTTEGRAVQQVAGKRKRMIRETHSECRD